MEMSRLVLYRSYGGKVRRLNDRGWLVNFQGSSFQHQRHFMNSDYGGEAAAYQSASEYRISLSDDQLLTFTVYAKNHPLPIRQYIAGFLDGDGWFKLAQDGSFGVGIAQASTSGVPAVITFLQCWYGGTLGERPGVNTNRRPMYSLHFNKSSTIALLHDIKDCLALKYKQAQLLFDYVVADDTTHVKELAAQMSSIKKGTYSSVVIPRERITTAYITGFFDAEGCVRSKKANPAVCSLVFAQAISPALLKVVADYYGSTHEYRGGTLHIGGDLGECIARNIYPFSIVKRSQLTLFFELRALRNVTGTTRSDELKAKLLELHQRITAEKHT
jgi:hypothetical protein